MTPRNSPNTESELSLWWLPRLVALLIGVVLLGYAFLYAIGPSVCDSYQAKCGDPDVEAKASRNLTLAFGFIFLVMLEWMWAYRRRRRRSRP